MAAGNMNTKMACAIVDVSDQTGTELQWRVTSANQIPMRVSGVSLLPYNVEDSAFTAGEWTNGTTPTPRHHSHEMLEINDLLNTFDSIQDQFDEVDSDISDANDNIALKADEADRLEDDRAIRGLAISGGGAPVAKPAVSLIFDGVTEIPDWFTLTRASSGTYVDYRGIITTAGTDTKRITYDPSTGRCLGLLNEPAATYMLPYSEDFSTGWTFSNNATIDTSETYLSPDGSSYMQLLLPSTVASAHGVSQSVAISSTGAYTQYIFVKAGAFSEIQLVASSSIFGTGGERSVYFDLDAETAGTGGYITKYNDDVYLCEIRMTAIATGTANIQYYVADGGSSTTSGDGSTEGIYIWGAGLVDAPRMPSYMKTAASAVTRAADITASTLPNGYDYDSASVYMRMNNVSEGSDGLYKRFLSLDDGTPTNRYTFYVNTTGGVSVYSGPAAASASAVSAYSNDYAVAASLGWHSIALGLNNAVATTAVTETPSGLTKLRFSHYNNLQQSGGAIECCFIWDKPITERDLRRMVVEL